MPIDHNKVKPKLAPPGAGLPPIEWAVAKYLLFPLRFKTVSPILAMQEYETESLAIATITEKMSTDELGQPRLIPRLRGLEDSSRYWSAAMTLTHLMIVGERMKQVVRNLTNGITSMPPGSTADVKPPEDVDCETVNARFEVMWRGFKDDLSALDFDRHPEATFAHPWFGELTAKQWMLFAAPHQKIHRLQIIEIKKRL